MTRKTRVILILLLGALGGGLVIAVSISGGEDDEQDTSGWGRVSRACDGLLVKLGLFPAPRCGKGQIRYTCIANLKQIHGAKATWALENKKSNTDIPTATDLYGDDAYVRDEPKCPQGGNYVIGSVQQKPLCSIPGHTI
jgi:hypothetical protein